MIQSLTVNHGRVGAKEFPSDPSRISDDEECVPGFCESGTRCILFFNPCLWHWWWQIKWALGYEGRNDHLSHVRGNGGLEKRLMAYIEYLQNKNRVSNIRHRENPNRFLTLVVFDCCCKCSTNLMISVIVQAKSSKGNPNESWETLRYTAVWNVSHLVDNCKHLDLGRWTKGEYGPGDVYSAKYLLERHHYRRPDLVKELQNRSTQSPTRPIAAWRISKTAAVWNTCSHIKRSSCEFI